MPVFSIETSPADLLTTAEAKLSLMGITLQRRANSQSKYYEDLGPSKEEAAIFKKCKIHIPWISQM